MIGDILKNLEVYSIDCFDSYYNRWSRVSDWHDLEDVFLERDRFKKYDRQQREYRIVKRTVKEEVVG